MDPGTHSSRSFSKPWGHPKVQFPICFPPSRLNTEQSLPSLNHSLLRCQPPVAPAGDNISFLAAETTNSILAMKGPPNPPELKEVGLAATSAGEGSSNCGCLSLRSGHHSGWPILFLAGAGRMVAASMWNPLACGAPGSYTRYHLVRQGSWRFARAACL